MIVCNNELLVNDKFHKYWKDTQKLKDLNNEERNNEYYIDTFLSKQILDALLQSLDGWDGWDGSIKYVRNSSIEIVPRFFGENRLFSAGDNRLFYANKAKIITPDTDINNINTGDLNTFATTEHEQVPYGNLSGMLLYEMATDIKFPTKLIFELTTTKGEPWLVRDMETLTTKVNLSIDQKIKGAMVDLQDKDDARKKEIADIEKRNIDEKKKNYEDRQKMLDEEVQEVQELSNYLHTKIKIVDIDHLKTLVKNNLDVMKQIINELKNCDEQTSEAQKAGENTIEGGKKHSKRDVLGKTMIIYKIPGDRKEYVRHKGKLITIKDYKAKKESKPKKKKKST